MSLGSFASPASVQELAWENAACFRLDCRAVLGQEVAFFDRAENNSGALVAALGRDTGEREERCRQCRS